MDVLRHFMEKSTINTEKGTVDYIFVNDNGKLFARRRTGKALNVMSAII